MNIFEMIRIDEDIIARDERCPDMINEKLYVGNLINASDKENLKNLGITHILIFASYIDPQFPADFTYKQVDVHDLPSCNIKAYLDECYTFIEEGLKQGSVLIHCAAGFSRSSTCAIAYLMKQNNWSYEKSFDFVKARRPLKYTNPNYGFKKQLKDYERELNIPIDC